MQFNFIQNLKSKAQNFRIDFEENSHQFNWLFVVFRFVEKFIIVCGLKILLALILAYACIGVTLFVYLTQLVEYSD